MNHKKLFYYYLLAGPLLSPLYSKSQIRDTARFLTTQLSGVLVNNSAFGNSHRAGYNGIAEMYGGMDSGKNLFVPKYAGLNLEHIFSGDSNSYRWHMYEPRIAPMKLVKYSNTLIELQQDRTDHWPLKTKVRFNIKSNYVDFTISATPLADAWNKYGYIGLFFASYIYEPEQRGIFFIGQSLPALPLRQAGTTNPKPHWIYNLPPSHGVQANHRATGSKFHPTMDTAGFPISLVTGVSDFEYIYPFYYGLRGENVLILMFEKPKYGEINFAQSPDGAGVKDPAWDFILYQNKYEVGKPFTFRARMVYKKFEGQEDVIKTYEAWSGKKVIRPQD